MLGPEVLEQDANLGHDPPFAEFIGREGGLLETTRLDRSGDPPLALATWVERSIYGWRTRGVEKGAAAPGRFEIRFLIAFSLLAGALLWMAPRPAAAQGGGAGRDTSQAGNILDRLDFHPTYQSSYSVNRTSRSWDQGLTVNRRLGNFDFNNSWSLGLRQDEAQNDLRSKRGSMKLNLDYDLRDLGGWTFGLDGDFRRDSQLSSFQDRIENKSNFGLETTSSLPEQILHSVLPFAREFSLSTGASLGYNEEQSINRRTSRIDSTMVSGLFQHYDLALAGNVRKKVRFTSTMSRDLRAGDSETRQRVSADGELIEEVKEKTENSSQRWEGSVEWKPVEKFRMNTMGRWIHEVNEYWDALANSSEGGQESKDGRDRNIQARLEWNPGPDMGLKGDLTRSDVEGDYSLQARDFNKHTTRGTMEGRLKLPVFLGPLQATELQASYTGDETESSLEGTADYKQLNRKLRTVLRRQLGSKVQISGTNEISLLRYLYVDRSNDRDEQRFFTDGVLIYNPSQKFNGLLNVNWGKRQTVNIPSAKATNNNTTETYKVSGEVGYKRGAIAVNQRYTVQADYTFYDFNETNNSIVRTNEVMTTFSDRIGTGLALQVQHQYQFRDSGKYVELYEGGPRSYTPTSEETRHMMTLSANYPLIKQLRIEGRQMFDRRQNRVVSSGRVTTRDRGEFSLRADFSHTFQSGMVVQASFQKTESTTEKNYWTVRAAMQRNF